MTYNNLHHPSNLPTQDIEQFAMALNVVQNVGDFVVPTFMKDWRGICCQVVKSALIARLLT
jgi:hypothetical protein